MIECEHCHKKTYAEARFCHLCGGVMKGKSKQVDLLPIVFVLFSAALGLVAFWILSGGELPH